jgi:hypothetical protein|tara:strand:- start:77 stop:304 length:228 start_codon:yes stop_codon:yes gene_type:complete
MLHTIEDLIRRLDTMKGMAIEIHRIRNQYSKISGKEYDAHECQRILENIQSLALGIAKDTSENNIIKTEMDEWKK